MICNSCGKENELGAKFCRFCGNSLSQESLGNQQDVEFRANRISLMDRLFNRRLNRRNYLIGNILIWILFFSVILAMGFTAGLLFGSNAVNDEAATWITLIGLCFFLFYSVSLNTRRFHDLNHSGWNFLWGFIPFGSIVLLVMLFLIQGIEQENKYGPKTKPEINIGEIIGLS